MPVAKGRAWMVQQRRRYVLLGCNGEFVRHCDTSDGICLWDVAAHTCGV
jgi:hypothetical protein